MQQHDDDGDEITTMAGAFAFGFMRATVQRSLRSNFRASDAAAQDARAACDPAWPEMIERFQNRRRE